MENRNKKPRWSLTRLVKLQILKHVMLFARMQTPPFPPPPFLKHFKLRTTIICSGYPYPCSAEETYGI